MATGEELGVGYVTLTVSTRGLGKDLAKQFLGAEKQASKTGKRMGKNVSEAFEDELDLDALAREIEIAEAKGTRAVEKASEAQKKAREKSQDAAAKQALEERRLAAARLKAENAAKSVADAERTYQRAVESSGESSREAVDAAQKVAQARERDANASVGVASAEDKVTRARRGAVSASEAMARATRDVTDAQDELQKELRRTREAYAEAEKAAKDAGDKASGEYVDGWRGMAARLGRVVRDNVNKALGSVGVAGKGFVQGVTYAESFKKGMGSVKQSSPVQALGFLSGGRVMADMGSHFTKMTTNLDRAIPMLALAGAGVASLAGAALSATSGLMGVVAGLGSIVSVGLLLPGMFAAAGAGIAVLGMALADTGEVLKDLGPKFEALQKHVSANFWAEAAQPIRDFANSVLPILNEGLGAAATQMGRWAIAITGVLGSAQGLSFISEAIGYMVHAADIAGDGIAAMTGALLQLATVGMSYLPDLASWFNEIAYTFEAWVAKSVASGEMFGWIDAGIANLKALGGVLFHTVGIFHALGQAAYDAGSGGLIGLASGMKALDEAMHGPVFQGALVTLFKGADVAMQGLAVGVRGLGDAFVAMAPTLAHVMGVAGQAVGLLIDGIAKALATPVFQQGLRDFFDGVLVGAQALAPVLPILGEKFGYMASLAGAMAANLGGVLAVAVENLAPLMDALFQAVTPLIPAMGNIVKAVIEGAAPVLGVLVGIIAKVIGVVIQVVSWLSQFSGMISVVASVVTVIAVAIGGFLVAVKAITTAIQIWTGVMWLFNAAVSANPIVLIGVAIAALVAAVVVAYNKIGWFKDAVNAVWAAIQTAASAVVTWFQTVLVPWFQAALAAVGAVFTWLWVNIVQPVWAGIQFAVSSFVTWFMAVALPWIQSVIQGIGAVMTWLWVNIIQPVWNGIMVFLTVIIAAIVTLFQGIMWVIRNVVAPVFAWFYNNVIIPVWNGILTFLTVVVAAIVTVFQGIVWFVRNVLGPVFSWLHNAVILPVWNANKNAISAAWAFIRDSVFAPMMGFIRGPLTSAWLWIRNTVSQVWTAIRNAISSAWNWTRNSVLIPLISFVRGALTSAWTWLRNLVSQVWAAIRSTISSAWNWIRNAVLSPAIGFIRGAFSNAWTSLRDLIGRVWGGIRGASSAAWGFVRDHVFAPFRTGLDTLKRAFTATKDGIATAWDKLRDAVKTPIAFVVNSVVNPFLNNYNKINDFWDGGDIDTIKGFARGGVLPGYQRRKRDDVLTPMRSGEGVLVPEVVRGIGGASTINALNAAGNSGGVNAVRRVWDSGSFARGPEIGGHEHEAHAGPTGGPSGGLWGSIQTAMNRTGRLYVPDTSVRGGNVAEAAKAWMGQSALDIVVGSGSPGVRPQVGHRGPWGFADTSGNLEISSSTPGNRVMGTIIHELGHILSLGHPPGGYGATGSIMSAGMAGGDWPHAVDYAMLRSVWGKPGDGVTRYSASDVDGVEASSINPMDWIREKLDKFVTGPIKAAKDKFAKNKFVQMGTGLAGKMFDGIKGKAADLLGKMPGFMSDAIDAGKAVFKGAANKVKVTAWITEALAKKGLANPGNIASGVARAFKESGGNPSIIQQIRDINSGGNEARGLMQVIPPTFRANMEPGHGNILDPVDNILASINYTLKRYGSVRAGWDQPGGYALGGIVDHVWDAPVGTVHALRPGVSTIYNGTGSTEMFQRITPDDAGGDRVGTVELSATDRALLDEIRRAAAENKITNRQVAAAARAGERSFR